MGLLWRQNQNMFYFFLNVCSNWRKTAFIALCWFLPYNNANQLSIWTVFKAFIESVTILLLFYPLVSRPGGVWDPSPVTRGSNPHPLHWKVKSEPPDHQGSPPKQFLKGSSGWRLVSVTEDPSPMAARVCHTDAE